MRNILVLILLVVMLALHRCNCPDWDGLPLSYTKCQENQALGVQPERGYLFVVIKKKQIEVSVQDKRIVLSFTPEGFCPGESFLWILSHVSLFYTHSNGLFGRRISILLLQNTTLCSLSYKRTTFAFSVVPMTQNQAQLTLSFSPTLSESTIVSTFMEAGMWILFT